MEDCKFRAKIFGCKFEAVYNETPPDPSGLKMEGSAGTCLSMVSRLTKREFVGMRCVRCGRSAE